MANFTVNKKESVSVTAAALTSMQERATAKVLEFVYTKAGKKNAYSDVNDLCKDKALVAELKKIFVQNNTQLFSYDTPVDIKSSEGEWLENFFQQQKTMIAEYPSPGWKVFNRDGGFMEYITDLVRVKFNISKKDSWDPADIWLIKKSPFYRKKIEKAMTTGSKQKTIKELNAIMRTMFKNKELVGVSLKKISTKVARFDRINVDESFFKNLENKSGNFNYLFSRANLKLGWNTSKKNFETKDGNIWTKDGKDNENYKFQLKGNQGSDFTNLKFEPVALGGAAFLGKAPLDLVEKLVKDSEGVPNDLFSKKTRSNIYFPKSFAEYNSKAGKNQLTAAKYGEMFTRIKSAGVDTGGCTNVAQFQENIKKGFNSSEPWNTQTKLMILFFLDQLLSSIKLPEIRNDFLTDLIFLASKAGRQISDFGPFGKLY